MDYGKRIKQLREQKGVKACYVAEKLGLTPAGYSKIENGKSKLTAERAFQVAQVLEIDVKDVFLASN